LSNHDPIHLALVKGGFVSLRGNVPRDLDGALHELLHRSDRCGEHLVLCGGKADKGGRNAGRVDRFRRGVKEGGSRFLELQGVERIIKIARLFVHEQERGNSPYIDETGVGLDEFEGRIPPVAGPVGKGFPGAFGVGAHEFQLSVFGRVFRHGLDKVVHGRAFHYEGLDNVVFLWIGRFFESLDAQNVH